MHLFIGLLLFLAVIVLTGLYILIGWTIVSLIINTIKVLRKRAQYIRLKMLYPKYLFLTFFSFFIVYNLSFYMNMRSQWIWSEGNAHLEAKEYFVSGQVLYGFRRVLNQFGMHPENPIMSPLNVLQKYIFDKGVRLLPTDDAEWAVWEQLWFSYLYTYREYWTKDTDYKAGPNMIKLLNQIYKEIEAMNTLPIADQRMYDQHYLRNIVGLADYYVLMSHYYFKENKTNMFWVRDMIQSQKHMKRFESIFVWLNHDLPDKWEKNSYMKKQIKQNSMFEVWLLNAVIGILEKQVVQDVYLQKFNCGNKHNFYYEKARIAMDIKLKTVPNKKEANFLKKRWWHSPAGLFIEKVNRDFCHKEIYGSKKELSLQDFDYLKRSGFVDLYDNMKIDE